MKRKKLFDCWKGISKGEIDVCRSNAIRIAISVEISQAEVTRNLDSAREYESTLRSAKENSKLLLKEVIQDGERYDQKSRSLEDELGSVKTRHTASKRDLEIAMAMHQSLSRDVDSRRVRMEEFKRSYAEMVDRTAERNRNLAEIQSDIEMHKSEIDNQTIKLNNLRLEFQKLEEEESSLQERCESSSQEVLSKSISERHSKLEYLSELTDGLKNLLEKTNLLRRETEDVIRDRTKIHEKETIPIQQSIGETEMKIGTLQRQKVELMDLQRDTEESVGEVTVSYKCNRG